MEVFDSEIGVFASWFIDNRDRGNIAVVCPDSMSFVTEISRQTTTKSQWLSLAKAYQVSGTCVCVRVRARVCDETMVFNLHLHTWYAYLDIHSNHQPR